MAKGSPVKIALVVFWFSLNLRVIWAFFAHVTPVLDFDEYDWRAITWLNTGQFGSQEFLAYRTPGYPGFLAAVYAIFGHSVKAAALAQAVLGAITSGLVVLLASRVVSPRTSAIAGALHALSPTAVVFVPVLASENLAVPLVAASVLCLAVTDEYRDWRRNLAIAGSSVLLGLLILVRPAAVFLIPAFLLLTAYSPRKRAWRPRSIATFVLAMGFVLAPWLIRNYRLGLGYAKLGTSGGMNLWMGNNDFARKGGFCMPAMILPASEIPEKERDNAYLNAAIRWILENPGRYLRLCCIRAAHLAGPEVYWGVANHLIPTAENDAAVTAYTRYTVKRKQDQSALIVRGGEIASRNLRYLSILRALSVPWVLLSLGLAVLQWRRYAIIVLPPLVYFLALSLTFAHARHRIMCDYLFLIPLAALLSDVLLGSEELGTRPSRKIKIAGTALVVLASMSAYAAGLQEWYRVLALPPARGPEMLGLLGYRVAPVEFAADVDRHRSLQGRGTEVSVKREEDGIRCEVKAIRRKLARYSGGMQFSVPEFDLLRLDLTLLNAENVESVWVDGYDGKDRVFRSEWVPSMSKRPPGKRAAHIVFPGVPLGEFSPRGKTRAGTVKWIHVLLHVPPHSQAAFILHEAHTGVRMSSRQGSDPVP